jgi:hypothetical protein
LQLLTLQNFLYVIPGPLFCLKVYFADVFSGYADTEKNEAAYSPEGTNHACPSGYRVPGKIPREEIHNHRYTDRKKRDAQKGNHAQGPY